MKNKIVVGVLAIGSAGAGWGCTGELDVGTNAMTAGGASQGQATPSTCAAAIDAAPALDGTAADAADAAEGSPGVGPFDASDLAAALVMTCDGAAPTVSLTLPCLLGLNLDLTATPAGYNVLACQLAQSPDAPLGVLSLIVPLVNLPAMLNEPVILPFANVPGPPPSPTGDGGLIAAYPGEHFSATLSGTAVFSAVDPDGRAFVAHLQQATFVWTGDRGDQFSCTVSNGPFWAAPGGFR
jgi:hypothetical protein